MQCSSLLHRQYCKPQSVQPAVLWVLEVQGRGRGWEGGNEFSEGPALFARCPPQGEAAMGSSGKENMLLAAMHAPLFLWQNPPCSIGAAQSSFLPSALLCRPTPLPSQQCHALFLLHLDHSFPWQYLLHQVMCCGIVRMTYLTERKTNLNQFNRNLVKKNKEIPGTHVPTAG